MLLTPHILTATAIASQTHNAWLVGVLSVASHYLLDALPHTEYNIRILKKETADSESKKIISSGGEISKAKSYAKIKVYLDFLIGITISSILAYQNNFFNLIIPVIFFSLLPDGLLYLYWHYPHNRFLAKLRQFHHFVHIDHNKMKSRWLGIGIQTLVIFLCFLILI